MLAFILAASLAANTDKVLTRYERHEAAQLVPLLSEVIRFRTDAYHPEAHEEQKAWLRKTATELGFVVRDAGKITEIELPGPKNAPVLGLIIHGDVQQADEDAWSFPAYGGEVRDGYVLGRGAADDKGPLIQALLTMKSLKESGIRRTHTIRLLVGSEEESSATEMPEYLKDHAPPDYSLVLDSEFPVVVGEKAWDGLAVATKLTERGTSTFPYEVAFLDAGLSPSIVPDYAEVRLRWKGESGLNWDPIIAGIEAMRAKLPPDTRLATGVSQDAELRIRTYGKSAHSGVNLTGGRNALVALARIIEGKLPAGGADDLFAFARLAGQDLHGTGLGITDSDPVWGRYGVNVATIKYVPEDPTRFMLYINLRRIPPRTAPQMKAHLESVLAKFNQERGSSLEIVESQSYFQDEPLGFDPKARIVKRLMRIYERATGEKNTKPAISGGGTYAKRLPNAIAFGMWFPGKPYPGHDLDEKIAIDDLQRGSRVLIHALVDIATGKRMKEPFKR
jgi:succinyl-diaminopimelate desuccinylase